MSAPREDEGPRPVRHLSSFHIEGARLGALSADDLRWVEAHRVSCQRCGALADRLALHREEFAATVLPRTRLALRQKIAAPAPRRWWLLGLVLAPVAAAAVLLLVARPSITPAGEELAIAEKGGPALAVVARREARIFALRSGDRVRPGDEVRFVLRGVTHPYGMIASVDGAGTPNIYVPFDGSTSVTLARGDRVELDGSVVLDGRLGPERVFALFSRSPISAEPVRRALAAIGAKGEGAIRKTLVLPVGVEAQSTMLLEKVRE
jgi:hypothetical protein